MEYPDWRKLFLFLFLLLILGSSLNILPLLPWFRALLVDDTRHLATTQTDIYNTHTQTHTHTHTHGWRKDSNKRRSRPSFSECCSHLTPQHTVGSLFRVVYLHVASIINKQYHKIKKATTTPIWTWYRPCFCSVYAHRHQSKSLCFCCCVVCVHWTLDIGHWTLAIRHQ
jgi:hypothetical protein